MSASRESFRKYVNERIDSYSKEMFHCTDYAILLKNDMQWIINHIGFAEERACDITEGQDEIHS